MIFVAIICGAAGTGLGVAFAAMAIERAMRNSIARAFGW